MVESKYVLYGLIAGVISGAIQGTYAFLITLPRADEVINEAVNITHMLGINVSEYKDIIYLAIYLTPVLTAVFMLILGAIFGALFEFLSKRLRTYPALITTLGIMALILAVPNVAVGSYGKALSNLLGVAIYGAVLTVLVIRGLKVRCEVYG
ncbi:MAG: hypothetical protein DRO18_07940 [Thermoprotei archaeon]|nr:MAG: hypothetical protein B6U85_09045 [Desulfurococcales archaeon ex4484_42]RLG83396.1 MAG: hypothetical protein DRO18_07940 [Thermoprotei archaeon]